MGCGKSKATNATHPGETTGADEPSSLPAAQVWQAANRHAAHDDSLVQGVPHAVEGDSAYAMALWRPSQCGHFKARAIGRRMARPRLSRLSVCARRAASGWSSRGRRRRSCYPFFEWDRCSEERRRQLSNRCSARRAARSPRRRRCCCATTTKTMRWVMAHRRRARSGRRVCRYILVCNTYQKRVSLYVAACMVQKYMLT